MTWYGFFRALVVPFVHAICYLEVVGEENVPATGPCIVVANHQGFLDPFLVQTICKRPLHTLAKSTQFAGRIMSWLMPRINAIPTRRYRVEPQAVRVVLRSLAEGKAVGIYPEGERSWDGEIQPFRRGTIRLLLKAGVPVVPCGISGSYDLMPRWSKTIRRARVRVEFGEPILWPAMDDRAERNAFRPVATEQLMETLKNLSRWEPPGKSDSRPDWLKGPDSD